MYTFQVADDHPLFRNAIMQVIKHHYPDSIVNTSHNLEGTIRDLEQNPDTDLLLLDIHMPGSQDLFGLIMVRQKFPTIPVTIISANDSHSTINRAIGHGACGYIPKSCSPQDIYQAVDAILKGDRWVPKDSRNALRPIDSEEKDLAAKVATLTPQQYRVLCHLREGWLNKQIGYEMGLTEATIKAHITAIFRKLGITNRTQTVISLNKLSLDDVTAN